MGQSSGPVWSFTTMQMPVFTIAGRLTDEDGISIAGVRLTGLPGNPESGADGYYNVEVPFLWKGTVTPEKSGYLFNPAYRVYAGVSSDMENDYLGAADSDLDGLSDKLENSGCTDYEKDDSDGDLLPDGVEDADLDGVVDLGETDPCKWDSDGDGISDGVEDTNANGLIDDGETDPTLQDTDGDGVSDGFEDANKNGVVDDGETDPTLLDSDFDGYHDGDEILAGSDPLVIASTPCVICVDPWGGCNECGFEAFCATSINGAIEAGVDSDNPNTVIKIYQGEYFEDVIVEYPCRLVISEGNVVIYGPYLRGN